MKRLRSSVMDIKAFLQCKKLRRSHRLEAKEKPEIKSETMCSGSLGHFVVLPLELKFLILRYLTVEDLSILTITSKAMRNLIEGYRVLMPLIPNVLLQKLHVSKSAQVSPQEQQKTYLEIFHRLGLLTKRSTCLYATRDRLKFVNGILTKMMCNNADCDNLSQCLSLTCFGKFLHTVIAGWDDSECQRTYDAIIHHTCLLKNVKLVMSSKPGTHAQIECEVRMFLRRVILDHCQSVVDRAFWLGRILKPWPMVHQARILFMLYGPESNGEIQWFEFCENTPANPEQSAKHFGELANAIQILYGYRQEWSEDDIISVLDELTSSPDEWLAENVAHMLILCGDVITSKMLMSKAINGRTIELSSITTSFCVVCVKNSFSLSYVLGMIQNIIGAMDKPKDRLQYFNSLMDMFRELILDIHEFSDQEDGHENDMYFMVTALSEFTKKLVILAFKNMLTI
ncbi:F-box only protein 47-like [Saccostrea cucullata]|uniref:F-box only protein 47-like n=1 Tax=Saccostrea cuccullata TaxID=36930 RepID=UPI002ED1B72F